MKALPDLASFSGVKPSSRAALSGWLIDRLGVKLPSSPVCEGHAAPLDILWRQFDARPPALVVLGARGAGKSFLSAINAHMTSRFHPGHQTRILGGSFSQSRQIYNAIDRLIVRRDADGRLRPEARTIDDLLQNEARYANGSDISLLAASATSVRGPHAPTLMLDEVDEFKPEIFEAAIGMAMVTGNIKTSVVMTSTYHKVDGPMSSLIERAAENRIPLETVCVFDVLERCPPSRSGKKAGPDIAYQNCPACKIREFCHSDIHLPHAMGEPKAKRARGHYRIDDLISKMALLSRRAVEAEFLCQGPSIMGAWFPQFDRAVNVAKKGEAKYDPRLPIHLAIDPGAHCGAVFFQRHSQVMGGDPRNPVVREWITIPACYYKNGITHRTNANRIKAMGDALTGNIVARLPRGRALMDPAGGADTGYGTVPLAEFAAAGLACDKWPRHGVVDGLDLVESFLSPALGLTDLLIDPSCDHLIRAFEKYVRDHTGGVWRNKPKDPQHPHEELMDSLRGGLVSLYPTGRISTAGLDSRPVSSLY